MTISLLGYTLNLLSIIGILTFLVVIITEMIKGFGIIKRIPTKLTALVVALLVIIGAMVLYLNMAGEAFVWWYLVIAFFAAFIVGYLSMYGWDSLSSIWKRCVPSRAEFEGNDK